MLDIDGAPAIARRFAVQGISLLVRLRDGEEIDRLVGAVPSATLRAMIEGHVGAGGAETSAQNA